MNTISLIVFILLVALLSVILIVNTVKLVKQIKLHISLKHQEKPSLEVLENKEDKE